MARDRGVLRTALFKGLTAAGRVLERGSALLHYAAAGTLRVADLESAIERQWDSFGKAADHIEGGLMSWEETFYGRHIRKEDHVLVIGCGTGRDLLALLDAGHRVDGVDFVGIDVARREVRARGHESLLLDGAIDRVELPTAYDVLVFSWYCYPYIPGSARRVQTLEHLKPHLRPSGRVLISLPPLWAGPRRLDAHVARAASWLTSSDWRPEPGDWLFAGSSAAVFPRYEHSFGQREAQEEFARAGYRVADYFVAEDGVRCYALTC